MEYAWEAASRQDQRRATEDSESSYYSVWVLGVLSVCWEIYTFQVKGKMGDNSKKRPWISVPPHDLDNARSEQPSPLRAHNHLRPDQKHKAIHDLHRDWECSLEQGWTGRKF
jgi:hypothetical protein